MTFRPSDDVLDELANGQQPAPSMDQYSISNQDDGQHMFINSEDFDVSGTVENNETNSVIIDVPTEEVKAPDLSELLGNAGGNTETQNVSENNVESIDNSVVGDVNNVEENVLQETNSEEEKNIQGDNEVVQENKEIVKETSETMQENKEEVKTDVASNQDLDLELGKFPDASRSEIVAGIEGGINSKLDFFVDENWLNMVNKYRKFYRVFFRWGAFILVAIIGVLSGVSLQVWASQGTSYEMVDDATIQNKAKMDRDGSEKDLSSLVDSGLSLEIYVPYGSASQNGKSFQSKNNLIGYKGVILPQLASVNYNKDDFVSMKDFEEGGMSRDDLKQAIHSLIIDDSIYSNTTNLPNVLDSRWVGNEFQGGLIDGFSLGCLDNDKASDFVCNKFLDSFYEYGKYYNLSEYASEVLDLTRIIKKQGKDISPICQMVKQYVLRAGVISDSLNSVMDYCSEDDIKYYRKLINFIDLENSLRLPELSDKVFDDPDLNAYKLLSAQQTAYKIIKGKVLNEGYIKSYLNFVQALIDKDNGTNRYILPFYKDELYVFNMDELYSELIRNSLSELKLKIDEINNGNSWYGHPSLLSQLTTSGIVQVNTNIIGTKVEQKSLDELFAQYYSMTDRLKVRGVKQISEDQLRVQTELFTDKIMSASNGQTLKVTVVLSRKDNSLYIDSIKIANQPKFTDILGIRAADGNVKFNDMINYIDEQVGMWYDLNADEGEGQLTICEQLSEMEVSLYACDDVAIQLYKGDIEYNFTLENGILQSYTIGDDKLNDFVKNRLRGVMFTRDNTPTIIKSIIDFTIETKDESLEKKLDIINQFQIHFKLVPDNVSNIQGKTDEFFVEFTLGDFKLQANYDINTHLLTKITYANSNCEDTLEIRGLSIALTTENEPQLIEIINNPKVFFVKANSAAYKKYQKMCNPTDRQVK